MSRALHLCDLPLKIHMTKISDKQTPFYKISDQHASKLSRSSKTRKI